MKVLKNVFIYLLTIILSVSIILLVAIKIASSTILDKNYVLSKLDETSYYEKTYIYVKSNFDKYIQQSGLDEEVLEDIVTEEQIKQDTQKILNNIYNNSKEEIDIQSIKEKLNNNINKSLGNMKLTSSQRTAIDQYVEKICEEYKTSILQYNVEDQVNNMYKNITDYSNTGNTVAYVAIAVIIILLLVLNIKRIYKFFTYIGISCFSSGVLLIFVNSYIISKVKIQTITILNDTFSFTLRNVLQNIVDEIKNYGWMITIISLVLIIVPNLIHNIKTKEKN